MAEAKRARALFVRSVRPSGLTDETGTPARDGRRSRALLLPHILYDPPPRIAAGAPSPAGRPAVLANRRVAAGHAEDGRRRSPSDAARPVVRASPGRVLRHAGWRSATFAPTWTMPLRLVDVSATILAWSVTLSPRRALELFAVVLCDRAVSLPARRSRFMPIPGISAYADAEAAMALVGPSTAPTRRCRRQRFLTFRGSAAWRLSASPGSSVSSYDHDAAPAHRTATSTRPWHLDGPGDERSPRSSSSS